MFNNSLNTASDTICKSGNKGHYLGGHDGGNLNQYLQVLIGDKIVDNAPVPKIPSALGLCFVFMSKITIGIYIEPLYIH